LPIAPGLTIPTVVTERAYPGAAAARCAGGSHARRQAMKVSKRARRLAIALTGLVVIGAAVYGAAAFAGDGAINTIRVLPGPTSAAEAAAIAAAEAQAGSDFVASGNVEFVKSFKLAADGVGARVVGNYL